MENPHKNSLHVILGPTSTGKTNLAIDLAKKFNGVLVSADSRQVVKYMDIGTGKLPLVSENNDVKVSKGDEKWAIGAIDIWGYDIITPDQYFSASDYAKFALNKINELVESENFENIFLVGGTGLYIDVVTGRIRLEETGIDLELRTELEGLDEAELLDRLTSLNLKVAKKIDKHNKRRLIRAVEKSVLETKKENPKKLPKLISAPLSYIGLTSPREVLYKKSDAWLDHIWENGLMPEAKNLLKKYPKSERLNGLIYKSAIAFLTRELSIDEAKQRAKYDLHHYIRRQQTYFKKNQKIQWFDVVDPKTTKKISELII